MTQLRRTALFGAGLKFAAMLLLFTLSTGHTYAESIWQGNGPADQEPNEWFNADNWSGGPPNGITNQTVIDNSNRQFVNVIIDDDPVETADAGALLVVRNSGELSLTGGGLVAQNVTTDGGTIFHSGGNFSVANAMSIAGGNIGYVLSGAGRLTVGSLTVVNGSISQSGGILSGTVNVNSGADATFGGGQFNGTLVNDGAVSFDSAQPLVFSAPISGGGRNLINSAVTFSAQNSFTGMHDLRGGSLSVSSDGNLGQAGASLNFDGGTLRITGEDLNSLGQHPVTWITGGGIDIADSNNAFAVSQDLGLPGPCNNSDCEAPLGLTKLGAGTLVLTGNNTYLGGTFINEGTLQGDSESLPGDISVAQNARLIFAQASAGTFAGSLSGAGTLIKRGEGLLTLSGVNSYGGGTTLGGGRLSVASDGNLGDPAGALNFEGGILQVTGTGFASTTRAINWGTAGGGFDIADDANTFVVSQVLTGRGGLSKLGAGTLVLNGVNTYAGGTTLGGGRLSVASDGNLGDPAGALNFEGGILQVTGTGFTSTTRAINWGTAGGGFDIADAANTFVVSRVLTGRGGLSKLGAGTLVLNGVNTYAGGTTLGGGRLSVASDGNLGDPAGALNFEGGILQVTGTGFTSTTRAINWGTAGGGFAIADAANTFVVSQALSGSGGLTKLGGGTLILNGNNTYTGLTVVQEGNLEVGDGAHARTATRDGASILGPVRVDPTGILSGHGTIIGSVNNFGTVAPGGSIGTLTVDGDVAFNRGSTFQVEISPTRASRLNATGQASLGNAAVNVVANAGTYTPRSYTILQAAGGVAGKFGKLSIPNALSIPSLRLMSPSLSYFADRVDLNLESVSSPVAAPEHVTRQLITGLLRMVGGRLDAPLGENCPVNRLGFWARGIGMISTADGDGFSPGYEAGTAGSVMGFDLQVSEHVSLGIAGFAGHSDVSLNQAARSDGSADSAMVSLYGAYTSGAWQFKSVLAYDNDTYTAQRAVAAGDARQAYSKTYGNRVNDYTELSYSFRSGDVAIQPILGVQLGWMRQNPLSESGTNSDGQNLSVDGRTLYTFDTLVGVRSRYERSLFEGLKAQFELRAVYDHDFGTLQDTVSAYRSDFQTVLLSTADRPTQRDAGIVGASLALLTANTLNFYLDYNGEIRGGQQAHFISAGVRYAW